MKTKTPEEYLKEPYSRVLIPEEGGGYSTEILEFPGCYSQGDTPNEAMANLEEAARGWIEAALAQGQTIPAPASNQGYSGKVALRLPRSVHREAMRMAERDGVSLNTFLVTAVATRVGAENFYNHMAERLEKRIVTKTAANVMAQVIPVIQERWDVPSFGASSVWGANVATLPLSGGALLINNVVEVKK